MRLEQSAAWGDFVAMQEALHARLSGQLQSGSNLSEADYAVLAVLQRRRKIHTRPHELAVELGWEKSRLHRQLVRMESRKLVSRREAPELGTRAIEVTVTEKGSAAFSAAIARHTAAVDEIVVGTLSDEDLHTLGRISRKLLRGIAKSAAS
ncbi:MarR family winged helix-turn-helix transcriptional regulator [Corynebacterium tuberculostearicum]|uniref:MarR family winged helix-turn-helix transcriptional regulator n=1 Tax=Corynebacterium tuberculostearicum TaxID=38304 RepID=UPI00265C9B4B|nr:MarR family winged helix-turn-helix transcriptional regulator [Corynebacterium tuberculostearicum]MDV2433256.1 MarR family winged helix-turn-helix transcriptional regulator [Corynebacterium tuberculostearicum]WKE57002.1 winged helix-turn-helix transcriptional regulator [Corynebacterium tuberculostearicum]